MATKGNPSFEEIMNDLMGRSAPKPKMEDLVKACHMSARLKLIGEMVEFAVQAHLPEELKDQPSVKEPLQVAIGALDFVKDQIDTWVTEQAANVAKNGPEVDPGNN